ncbi:MAG: sigma-70 family RNA polymerase sigma factor [Phycisphaerae bacterium]|nr:sigma-70 family RNA polymerase sigma factor [Phycisphaerae bacterium]
MLRTDRVLSLAYGPGTLPERDLHDENDILSHAARGGPDAFRACVDRFAGLVWTLARQMLRDRTDAEDAVQDVFAELWRVCDRFNPSVGSARSFVLAIARRRLIDRGRTRMRYRRDGDDVPGTAAAVAPTPATSVALNDAALSAADALLSLRQEEQDVLRLVIHHSWTHERVAEHLGMPVGTVKTHLRRGLMRLRDLMAAERETGGVT